MPQPKPTGPRCLGMDERIFIADGPVCGLSMSAIAYRLGRSRSTVGLATPTWAIPREPNLLS